MQLAYVSLDGYRRFHPKVTFDAFGPLVALIGQNNAGKSSVLRALEQLEDRDPVGRDATRRVEFESEHKAIEAKYLLEPDDIAAVKEIYGDRPLPKWYSRMKAMDGRSWFRIEPGPDRDLSDRRECLGLIEAATESQAVQSEDGSNVWAPESQVLTALQLLSSSEEKLGDDEVSALDAVRRALEARDRDDADRVAAQSLTQLLEIEKGPSLLFQAQAILKERCPRFVALTEDDRDLNGEYDLDEVGDDPPAALASLARLAKLDLQALRTAKGKKDRGLVKQLLETANEKLAEEFGHWSQFRTTVSIESGDGALIELLTAEADGTFSPFDDQSDGFRVFVALAARVMTSDTETPPIVVIDEIEMHLHYDAEADLLRLLAEESAVGGVVYSTHSIGCLPPDLGTGVRVVRRKGDSAASEVDDHLWRNDVGIQPLLYAMGAAQLSFIPLRDAVIAEGPSELIVLPTLLREAAQVDVLPFQVLPGAAQARPSQIAGLDLEAPRVVWLLDGDRGGDDHAKKVEALVAPARVMRLRGDDGSAIVLEDLVDPDVYIRALNAVLRKYHSGDIAREDVGDVNRPNDVKKWCEDAGISPPAKLAVCHNIVAQRVEFQLLDEQRRGLAKQLFDDMNEGFAAI